MITQKNSLFLRLALQGRFIGSHILQENEQGILVKQVFCCIGLDKITTLSHAQILARIVHT